jgi:hypothetical protein
MKKWTQNKKIIKQQKDVNKILDTSKWFRLDQVKNLSLVENNIEKIKKLQKKYKKDSIIFHDDVISDYQELIKKIDQKMLSHTSSA